MNFEKLVNYAVFTCAGVMMIAITSLISVGCAFGVIKIVTGGAL